MSRITVETYKPRTAFVRAVQQQMFTPQERRWAEGLQVLERALIDGKTDFAEELGASVFPVSLKAIKAELAGEAHDPKAPWFAEAVELLEERMTREELGDELYEWRVRRGATKSAALERVLTGATVH